MKYKLGILGLGKMGSSILTGILNANLYQKEEILLYDINEDVKKHWLSLGIDFNLKKIKSKDLEKIINQAIKGKNYSDRIKGNKEK